MKQTKFTPGVPMYDIKLLLESVVALLGVATAPLLIGVWLAAETWLVWLLVAVAVRLS